MNWIDFGLGALAATLSLTIILVAFALHTISSCYTSEHKSGGKSLIRSKEETPGDLMVFVRLSWCLLSHPFRLVNKKC